MAFTLKVNICRIECKSANTDYNNVSMCVCNGLLYHNVLSYDTKQKVLI